MAEYTHRRELRGYRVPPFLLAVVLALVMWAAIGALIAAIVSFV